MFKRQPVAENSSFSISRVVFFSIFLTAPFRNARFIEFLSIQDILIILRTAMIITGVNRNKPVIGNNLLIIGGLFSVLHALQSFLVATNPTESTINGLKFTLIFFLLPWVFLNDYQGKSTCVIAMRCFFIGAVLSSTATILANTNEAIFAGDRVSGFAGHPVFLGILLGLALSIGIVSMPKKLTGKIFYMVGFASLAYALALSASSTGFILIGVTFLILALLNVKVFNYRKLLLVIPFGILLVFAFLNLNIFAYSRSRFFQSINPSTGFTTNAVSGTSTLEARLFSIRFGWKKILESPIFGNGMDRTGRNTEINLEAHNLFIIGWQSGGLLVLAVMVVFFGISMKVLFSVIKLHQSLEIVIIILSWLSLLSTPLLYERSVITPLTLVLCAWLIESKKIRIDKSNHL